VVVVVVCPRETHPNGKDCAWEVRRYRLRTPPGQATPCIVQTQPQRLSCTRQLICAEAQRNVALTPTL
jgi:hypothetical protein